MTETILGADEAPASTEGETLLTDTDTEVKTEETPDTKVEGDVEGEVKDGEDGKADKPEQAPDKYEDFTLPENVTVDPKVLADAQVLFKDMNLSQESAQKLIDFQAANEVQNSALQQEAWDGMMKEWSEQASNDSEYGGTEMQANMAIAKKGRDAFGSDEFNTMLDVTGVGNHPEMVRFLFKLGKEVSEDKMLHGGKAAAGVQDPAKVMFPDMN